jgi:quinol monooxygenase YgiN
MITILFHMTAKAGLEDECIRVARDVTARTRAEDQGCISYTFYRRSDNPRELILFEQWQDPSSLAAHIERLVRAFGPPDDSEPYPPTHHRRRLPKAFLGFFEKTKAIRYDGLE